MLRKFTYLLLALTFIAAFISFRGKFYGSQPPTNHSGAPDGFGLCSSCHNNLNSGGGSVVFNGLPTSFQPGVTYPFSVTIAHPASRERWGFQINARNAGGEPAGTFASTNPNAAIGSGPAELSHNDAVFATGTSFTYTNLTWTAPATVSANNSQVTFYLAGNAANGDGNNTGDFIYTNTSLLTLPITLKDFHYKTEGHMVRLFWTTAAEDNSKEFVIEKSDNNKDFAAAGRLPAAGNSSSEKTYVFTDDRPTRFNQPLFYRLKMVDGDGTFRYSKTIQLVVKQKDLLVQSLFPNPASDYITLSIVSNGTTRASLLLTDVNGKAVAKEIISLQPGMNRHKLWLTTLQKGNYFVRLQTSDHAETHSFFKQ